ncbi:hypothetical protein RIF29_22779 [Crotalaria pallida]|uniref:Uncharacterized protein n=1 Tax=Crotalaria pallida TaxID=3830 RepID=A0AAN9F4T7_CROPI
MIKRFPSRGQRSKGIKVKHILQIILLLGVCFWLIYQVKHNHDKKKEFDENDAKLSVGAQTDQVLKFGRKDLHPVKDELNQNEKHEEVEEEENIVEDDENKPELNEQEEEGNKLETEESDEDKHGVGEQGDEENKHGAEEQEEDENKNEEIEDEGRGGGDEEIDVNDQDKLEVEGDRDEEFMDEEKEKEEGDEKENENSEDEKKGDPVENQSTHEAREEHYKGDDASSAVTHDTHTTSTETETFSLENSDVYSETNITTPENKTSYSDESNRNQNDSDLKVTEGELSDGTNSTAAKVTGTDSMFSPLDSSYPNKTATTNSDSLLEADNKTAPVTSEASNNLTGAGNDTSSSSEQNKTVILPESLHAQNTMANATVTSDVKNVPTEGSEQHGDEVSEKNLTDAVLTASVKTEHVDAGSVESSDPGAGELEKTIRVLAANETGNNSSNSDRNESSDASVSDKSKGNTETSGTNETQNADAAEDEMFRGDTQTDETDETLDSSSANGISDSIDGIDDSSDSHMHEDVTDVRTDLDTLPDIRNEGDNDDETAAE